MPFFTRCVAHREGHGNATSWVNEQRRVMKASCEPSLSARSVSEEANKQKAWKEGKPFNQWESSQQNSCRGHDSRAAPEIVRNPVGSNHWG